MKEKEARKELKEIRKAVEHALNEYRDLLIPLDRNTLSYFMADIDAMVDRIDPPKQYMMHTERKR